MQYEYKKKYLNRDSYAVAYYIDGKFQKYVNETKPAYMEYAKKNKVKVIPYVEPPPVIVPIAEKREQVLRKIAEKRIHLTTQPYLYNNKYIETNELAREMIKTGYNIAKNKINKGLEFKVNVVTAQWETIELNAFDIVAIVDGLQKRDLKIQDTIIVEYNIAMTTKEEHLDYYLKNSEFPKLEDVVDDALELNKGKTFIIKNIKLVE